MLGRQLLEHEGTEETLKREVYTVTDSENLCASSPSEQKLPYLLKHSDLNSHRITPCAGAEEGPDEALCHPLPGVPLERPGGECSPQQGSCRPAALPAFALLLRPVGPRCPAHCCCEQKAGCQTAMSAASRVQDTDLRFRFE